MNHKFLKRHIAILVAIFMMIISTRVVSTPSYATNYIDLDNHWAKSYIEMVTKYNAVSGYVDGSYKPNLNIKRIEFIAMILNAQDVDVRSPFTDEYWGQPYIEAALNSGLISTDEYGVLDKLAIEKDITREEMAKIVVNAYLKFGGTIDPIAFEEASSKLSDLDTVTARYHESAIDAIALGFISGYSNDTFAPKKPATRAQAAVLSYKLLVKLGTITSSSLPENIVLSKTTLKQGELLKISIYHITSTSEIELIQELYPDITWYMTDGVVEGYIPTNYNTSPGIYRLSFTNKLTGNTTTRAIEVTKRNFRVQNLTIDPNIEASTKTDDGYAEYRKFFNPSRESSSPEKYYTESFLIPTSGKVTTEFGEARIVNGVMTSYRHAGIDIAAPKNADVIATNTGKVVLSMPLILTGNSIVIDHGEGLFSVYFHLDKLFVKEDDLVSRGQLIGAVGSTGFSTGPHLHFTMSYYRFDIEPGYILYGESFIKGSTLKLSK